MLLAVFMIQGWLRKNANGLQGQAAHATWLQNEMDNALQQLHDKSGQLQDKDSLLVSV